MLAASNDTIVSTAAIEEFAYHLRAGSHLVIAGSKHEILQEQDRYRAQFWAAFDAFVPGTPLFKCGWYSARWLSPSRRPRVHLAARQPSP